MSFDDNDRDRADYLGGPYASCADCGRATDSTLCDECADTRDAHTSTSQLRMAQAVLPDNRRKAIA
jgi:anti-sigma factor ChrR (cupin superfamily)